MKTNRCWSRQLSSYSEILAESNIHQQVHLSRGAGTLFNSQVQQARLMPEALSNTQINSAEILSNKQVQVRLSSKEEEEEQMLFMSSTRVPLLQVLLGRLGLLLRMAPLLWQLCVKILLR